MWKPVKLCIKTKFRRFGVLVLLAVGIYGTFVGLSLLIISTIGGDDYNMPGSRQQAAIPSLLCIAVVF